MSARTAEEQRAWEREQRRATKERGGDYVALRRRILLERTRQTRAR